MRPIHVLILALATLVPAVGRANGARSFKSGPIQVSADGAWAWVVNPDDDSVTRIDAATDDVRRFPLAPTCVEPEGVSVREDGAEAWIACRGSDDVVVLRGLGSSVGEMVATIPLPFGSGPYGIALSPDQSRAVVTLSRLPGAAVLDVTAHRVVRVVAPLSSTPLGVAFTLDGGTAWITHLRRQFDFTFLSGIDLSGAQPELVTRAIALPAAPLRSGSLHDADPTHDVAEGGYLTFRGTLAQPPAATGRAEMWVPTQYGDVHEDSYPSPPDSTAQVSLRHFLLGAKTMPETLTDKVIVTAAQVHGPTTGTWMGPGWDAHVAGAIDIGFSADGAVTYLVNELSWDVLVMPTDTPAFKPSAATPPLVEIPVGARPTGMALSPTSSLAWVSNRLGDPSGRVPGRTVSVVDLATQTELRQISVAPETFSPDQIRGARIFHSSAEPVISAKSKAGCATCHPQGEDDASVWDLQVTPGNHGPRMAPSLLGLGRLAASGERDADHGYGLLHHSGDRDEVQDFDFTFRGVQLGGTGFLGAGANAELGPPNAGLSADLDALDAYVRSLPPFSRSPHRLANGALSPSAVRGAAMFSGSDPAKPGDASCATCHDPARGFQDARFHDVGYRSGTENEVNLRDPPWELKTESLIGAWATPPYEGVVTARGGQAIDMIDFLLDVRQRADHGTVAGLTTRQLHDLAEFILSIDGEMTPEEARLPDTSPPQLARVDPISLTTIAAWFDESVDPASAQDVASWRLVDDAGNAVPILAVAHDARADRVTLTTSLRSTCPPTTYTLTARGVRDLADRMTGGHANASDTSASFAIGPTFTVTLGASGWEDLTVPVHDTGFAGFVDAAGTSASLSEEPTSPPYLTRRGFVRFEWRDAFAAATGVASSSDIESASFSLDAVSGDAHAVEVRRVLQGWDDLHVSSRSPPAGSLTWLHHRTPSQSWNQPGAMARTAGVEGRAVSDYDGLNDTAFTPDAIVPIARVNGRTDLGGAGITDAYRFWFDHPAQDHGHEIALTADSVRELDVAAVEDELGEDGPVLTITYRVRPGVEAPPEVSSTSSRVPLLVTRDAGASLRLSFEDLAASADTYSVYAGDVGTWYSHSGIACGTVPAAAGGRRTLSVGVPEPSRYLLVTATNSCAEGISGASSRGVTHPGALLDCR